MNHQYVAIDLKSFYASVECVERKLDPLTTNLVVADSSRTEKTICLAVSPSLKAYGIPGRARLFEVIQKVQRINFERRQYAPGKRLIGSSCFEPELKANPSLALDFIIAKPQMSHYIKESTRIFNIYTRYIAPEDIHVYSVDEVFMDVTHYLKNYKMTARELTMTMIQDVLRQTHITATAGIGTNLYLSKVAMDIYAKHIPADRDGVRIAELDEESYRRKMWTHRPLTDFWRVGHGYARKLEARGLMTMGDIARCSLEHSELLYQLFGVNAELLIDHAWGWEPCTIENIKAYRPESNSLSSGQVLQSPYPFDQAKLVAQEMADLLVLDLVDKGLVTDQMVLSVGYDSENLSDIDRMRKYRGEIAIDFYGRIVPKPAHGSINLGTPTSSSKKIIQSVSELFDQIVDQNLLVRRMYIVANHVLRERDAEQAAAKRPIQLNMFANDAAEKRRMAAERAALQREKRQQQVVLRIKRKYGKNAIFRGMNLQEGATARARNAQIGGHNA